MKKQLYFLLIAVFLCIGCILIGNSKLKDSGIAVESNAAAGVKEDTATGKVLVAYYSASGKTKSVADVIIDTLGAERFEITPVKPYTVKDLDYKDKNSRVSKEHSDIALQSVELVSSEVKDFASYDVVFIGYPIWWGSYAWVITRFVADNDFSGKKVIPFCTSGSSGIGKSAEDLAKLAGTGDWQTGMRFPENPAKEDVQKWLAGIGFEKKYTEAQDMLQR